ncbi:MAG TPA: TolC family protein, partial [Urbifossiella sp.]|nr:TolC family protein [Urbifossiella sp.]
MQRSAATTVSACLARAAVALGFVVALLPNDSRGQQPAPVLPTVRIPGLPAAVRAKKPAQPPKEEKSNDGVPELSLGDCIAIAIERQPSLRAMRSSQEATAAGQHALNNIGRLGSLLSPDLPIRKEQAQRGVIAAAADLQKLHNEVVHDVTRLYYTVVYARQQQQLADDVVAQVETFVDIARKLLNSATPGDMTQAKLDVMMIALTKIKILQAKAHAGVKSAEAGLREIMGVADRSLKFRIKDKELPLMGQNVALTEQQIVDMALGRRPELALAAAAADAFRLEVYAQGKLRFRRSVPTLSSASD